MEHKDTKNYEIGFLTKELTGASEVMKFITRHGGEMIFEGPVERIALSYPIKKQSEAHFGYLHFSMAPLDIKKFDEELGRHQEVLRFLIVTPPIEKQKPRPMMKEKGREGRPPREAMRMDSKPAAVLPLSNEALEKKIEEILQE